MSRFAKLALSGLTALSLSLTPIPATAAPDGEDIAKVLAGLAVIGLIANAANDRKKKPRSQVRAANPYATIEGSRIIEGKVRRPGELQHRYRGVRRAALPERCARTLSTSRGDRTVYAARCLNRDYIYARELPSSCKLNVRTNNRVRTFYGARCLRRDGWQVARF